MGVVFQSGVIGLETKSGLERRHDLVPVGGLAAGLALGLLLAALLEYRDTSLRNERDVWAFTKLPTLAVVSCIDELVNPRAARRRWKLFSRMPKPIESTRG